jgi:hypothetical protein
MTNETHSHRQLSHTLDLSDGVYREILISDLNKIFRKHLNKNINATYVGREARNRFAAERIVELGLKNILNIGGGGKRHLGQKLDKSFTVFEIDIVGDCDLKINLDQIDRLPFDDNSFDLCCAFDVLEHIEQFHLVNQELYRISRSSVLISLPNCAAEIPFSVLLNRPQKIPDLNRGTFSHFAGLPLTVPNDRHRWWLYFQDIVRFYYFFARQQNCKLEFWTVKDGVKRKIVGGLFGRHLVNTFFLPHIWIKLTKPIISPL